MLLFWNDETRIDITDIPLLSFMLTFYTDNKEDDQEEVVKEIYWIDKII